MKALKFLLLFLLFLPIAKADGCGINCPHGNDLLTFSLSMLCQFFTWGFCHIFSFVVLVIVGIVICAFWLIQPDEKKKNIKLYLWGLFGLFVIIILSDYIKAFAYSSPFAQVDSCAIEGNDICKSSGSGTFTKYYSVATGISKPTSSTNYWQFMCSGIPESGTASILTSDGTPNPISLTVDPDVWYNVTVSSLSGIDYYLRIVCPSG
jgi:hypothetical protein